MAEPKLATVEDLLGTNEATQEATVEDILGTTIQGGTEEDWQSETDKYTDELDVRASIEAREAAEKSVKNEDAILQGILNTVGPSITIDGDRFEIQQALDAGATSTQILNTIQNGKLIRTDIDNTLEAGIRQGAYGLSNFLGTPSDLFSIVPRSAELGWRMGQNKLAEATGNMNLVASEDPQDFLFSSPNPILGGQWIRDNLEKLGFDYPSLDTYPEEQKVIGQMGRVVGESVGFARAPFTLAKMGLFKDTDLIKQAVKDPKKLATQEARAIGGALVGVGGVEYVFEDSEFAIAGAEVIGSILGANTVETAKLLFTTPRLAVKAFMHHIAPWFSEEASKKRAVHHIFKSAATAREGILQEIEVLKKAETVDQALIDELVSQADAFTPERMIIDLQAGMENAASGLPAGTLSENEALLSIQRRMMGDSKEFNEKTMNRVNKTLESLLRASELLARGGNEQAADILRRKYFQDVVNITITNKQSDVSDRLKALQGADNFRASQLATKTLFEAKDNMRLMETYLWDNINKNIELSGSKIGASIDHIEANDILKGMTIGGGGQVDAAIGIIYDKIKNKTPVSTGEVLLFRSIMLKQSRKAAAAEDFHQSAIFDALATAAAEDLSTLKGADGDAIDLARKFSAELNKRFTRHFPQDVLSKEAKGGPTIREEEVLTEGFGSGGDAAALNFEEMRRAATDATTFAEDVSNLKALREAELKASSLGDDGSRVPATQSDNVADPTDVDPSNMMPTDDDIIPEIKVTGIGDDTLLDPENPIPEYTVYGANKPRPNASTTPKEEFVDGQTTRINEDENPKTTSVAIRDDAKQDLGEQMFTAQEDFLRATVYSLRDATGSVSASQIDDFILANPRLLKDFPDLKTELNLYADAERTASEIVSRLNKAATSDRLPEAIADTLTSDNPADNFAQLANEAQGIPDAMIDFRMATMDLLFKASKTADGRPDFIQLVNNMGKPLSGRTGDLSIIDLMLQNNVISEQELEAVGGLINEGLRIQKASMDAGVFDQVVQDTPGFTKNAARVLGANVGVMFGRGDASLQAAAIGSAFVENLVNKLPMARDAKNIEILMSTPSLLAEMMQKNPLRQRTAFQTAKELLAKYNGMGLSYKQIAQNLVKEGMLGLGDSITGKTTATTYGTLTSAEDDEPPVVKSLDAQMMDLQ